MEAVSFVAACGWGAEAGWVEEGSGKEGVSAEGGGSLPGLGVKEAAMRGRVRRGCGERSLAGQLDEAGPKGAKAGRPAG